ncbi:MAG: HD domain-containing protein [Desulfobacterales bacterium]|jgi:uncharacterized protein
MFDGGAKIETAEAEARERGLIDTVRQKARDFFHGARGSHDWEHTERVLRLCRRIGPAEGADMTVLSIAALLHDIGRGDQDQSAGEICHAQHGAQKALEIVRLLPLDPDRQDNLLHCIRAHRFRGREKPRSVEAKVLFDADKLDAIGAVGVARAFLFAGEVGARLHNPDVDPAVTRPYTEDDTGYREYKLKLSKIRDRMLTAAGRRLAEERHAFMEAFFHRFVEEYQGKR